MNFCSIILFATMMMVKGNKVDIAIALDNPFKTIGFENYKVVLNEINSAIQNQEIGLNNTLIGFNTVLGYYKRVFQFANSKSSINSTIEELKRDYHGYINTTESMILEGITPDDNIQNTLISSLELFKPGTNRADAADNIVVIIFKDHNDNPSKSQAIAHQLGYNVYAIGIGSVTNNYLLNVAGSSDRAIKINDFNLLGNTLSNLFKNITTSVRTVTTLPISPIIKCNDLVNIIFVVDSFSTRVNQIHTTNGINALNFGIFDFSKVYVGYVAFCGKDPIYLNLQNNPRTLEKEITKCWFNFNSSNVIENYANQTIIGTEKALNIFASTTTRPNSRNIIVVVTDKVPPNLPILREVITRSIANNIAVYTVGIGNATYNSLVSVNGPRRTFYCDNHETFDYGVEKICN